MKELICLEVSVGEHVKDGHCVQGANG